MQTRQAIAVKRNDGIFFYLLLLTGFFLLLEISFFIECNKIYLADFTFVSDRIKIPVSILPGVIHFIFAQLLVHLVYCISVWMVAISLATLFSWPANRQISLGIAIWVYGILTIIVANQFYFPSARMSELTSVFFFNRTFTSISFITLALGCSIIVTMALFGLLKLLLKKGKHASILATLLVFICLGIFFYSGNKNLTVVDGSTQTKPNIIIVGVDSLRPDFLSFFGGEGDTPFFDSFLKTATVFSESVTPLARTFPSWTGILTGEYPKQIGIRSNLADQSKVDLSASLPAILHRNGYQTIFATDETRFSNIDKNYGFDHVITPPMGLNDFLIGTFNDFPMSNLIVNTTLGKWLFPHSYANRPVYFTYEPDSFLRLVSPTLKQSRTQPLFLAIHFCLPHSPYLWAGAPAHGSSVLEQYQASVIRADKQLKDFFAELKQDHLLDHAIVVLLSDHGEALELAGDRITEASAFLPAHAQKIPIPHFYPASLDKEDVNQSAGHGTDVLGLPQYHTLLAFKLYGLYGRGEQHIGTVPGLVTLLDIKPTLLTLINMRSHLPPAPIAGVTLSPIIIGASPTIPPHGHIFLESDFSPEAIHTVYPDTRKVMLEGIQLFRIDTQSTRLLIKDAMVAMIINSKQYADIYGEWMLALYPQNNHYRMPILINLNNGLWTNDLNSKFAQHSPALAMFAALKAFYGNEITNN